jgi:hypothetical protein
MTTTYSSKLTATDEFVAVMNPTGAPPAVSNVFRPKFGTAKTSTSQTALTPSVERAVGAADQLAQAYQKLRVEVLDRSDRALWEMLEQVYAYVQQVDGSAQKRETRNELIRKIQMRDSQGVASNATTEAVAVRYVFVDQSRQTRNNYTIAMEKARALDIRVTGFADFLAQHGGVGGVVETVFDHEAEEQATATHPPAPLLWCAGTKLAAESGGNGAGSACCVATSHGGDCTTWRGRTWGGGAGQRGHTHTRT